MPPFRIAFVFLAVVPLLNGGRLVNAADYPPAVLTDLALDKVPAQGLPEGWKTKPGSWSVAGDGEHQEGNHPVLTSNGGTIVYDGTEFGDFTFTTRIKYLSERNYWNTRILFRMADRTHFYQLGIERSGLLFLERKNGDVLTRLAESAIELPLYRYQWFWLRLRAKRANLAVDLSTDGVRFGEVIAFTDTQQPLLSGHIGLVAGGQMDFEPLPNLWHDDATLQKQRAWIDDLRPSTLFRQSSPGETLYSLEVAVDAVGPFSGLILEAQAGTKTITRALDPLNPGENNVELWIPVSAGLNSQGVTVRLLHNETELDHGATTIIALPEAEKFAAANPVPAKIPDFDRHITRDNYRKVLDTYYATLAGPKQIVVNWPMYRPADAAVLYRATGDPKYLDQVLSTVRRWLAERQEGKAPFPGPDFGARLPTTLCWQLALDHGNLNDEKKSEIRHSADDLAVRGIYEGGGVMNRALGYALGARPILKIDPSFALAPELKAYADAVEQQLIASGEEMENSTNYVPLTLFFMTWWLEWNNRQDLYQNPRIKNTYYRLLKMISPGGGLPWYGDYGGSQNCDPMLIASFEKAAVAYQDGRFKWAAHRLYEAGAYGGYEQTPASSYIGGDLFAFACAHAWADDSIPEVEPDFPSEILVRNNGYLDKCILRSGWKRNDFYAMIDLLDGCEHGDNNSLGLMSVYQNGAYALSDKGGRDRANHSLMVARENASDFPFAPETQMNRWQHEVIDLKLPQSWNTFSGGIGDGLQYCGITGSDRHEKIPFSFTYDPQREFAFIIRPDGTGLATLYLDDVKLVGKNGEVVLDDFEQGHTPWIGNFERSTEAHAGHYSGSFTMDFLKEAPWIGRKFPLPLDILNGPYDRLEFWYKFTSEQPQDLGVVMIGDNTGYPHNFSSYILPMAQPEVSDFHDTPQMTHAAFVLKTEDASSQPQTQEREVLFIKNKLLWVRDILTADQQAPFVAGPLWYSKGIGPKRGANWVDGWDQSNLLTYFVPRAGRTVTTGSTDRIASHNFAMPYFTYQLASGTGGQTLFDTLLIPHAATDDPQALAAQVQVLYDQNGATVIRMGGDLLLLNRSGAKIQAVGLDTDAPYLLLHAGDNMPAVAYGEAGRRVTYKGQSLTLQ